MDLEKLVKSILLLQPRKRQLYRLEIEISNEKETRRTMFYDLTEEDVERIKNAVLAIPGVVDSNPVFYSDIQRF